ncbi:MAG: hypothetical protein OEU36_06835 [Gammaproteobacteria bacterium]|nr:hypothetical protein [Gammaproteobacteria bacterium]
MLDDDKKGSAYHEEGGTRAVSRRRLLKCFAVGGGVATSVKMLPERWTSPVVDFVTIPAHAQTSPLLVNGNFAFNGGITDAGDSLLDFIIPRAVAGERGEVSLTFCGTAKDSVVSFTGGFSVFPFGGGGLKGQATIGGSPVDAGSFFDEGSEEVVVTVQLNQVTGTAPNRMLFGVLAASDLFSFPFKANEGSCGMTQIDPPSLQLN